MIKNPVTATEVLKNIKQIIQEIDQIIKENPYDLKQKALILIGYKTIIEGQLNQWTRFHDPQSITTLEEEIEETINRR